MIMTRRNAALLTVAAATLFGAWTVAGQQPQQQTQAARQQSRKSSVTKEQFEKWVTELSNWGRWGKDDERGALNLITPAKATAGGGAGEVRHDGLAVTASPPNRSVQTAWNDRWFHEPVLDQRGYILERQSADYHGGTLSHFDALCHVSFKGKNYNGFNFADIATADGGCKKLTVDTAKDGIVTRGLLLDLPDTQVKPEDIAAWEKKTGLHISAGDALILRTHKAGSAGPGGGYDPALIPLLKQRDVALIGSDVAQEGGEIPDMFLPIHVFALTSLGVNLLDNLGLDDVAATADRLKRWEFMLVVEPIRVMNGAGAPINPVAIF